MPSDDLKHHLALGLGRIANTGEHSQSRVLDMETHLVAPQEPSELIDEPIRLATSQMRQDLAHLRPTKQLLPTPNQEPDKGLVSRLPLPRKGVVEERFMEKCHLAAIANQHMLGD